MSSDSPNTSVGKTEIQHFSNVRKPLICLGESELTCDADSYQYMQNRIEILLSECYQVSAQICMHDYRSYQCALEEKKSNEKLRLPSAYLVRAPAMAFPAVNLPYCKDLDLPWLRFPPRPPIRILKSTLSNRRLSLMTCISSLFFQDKILC